MTNKGRKLEQEQQEIEQRRDDAIKRALRTPPTHLKDIPKKRKPKTPANPENT